MQKTKTVLIAPLNWGLGHATRCVPIIRLFVNRNWKVHICGDGPSFGLLKEEFPELTFHPLPELKIHYPKGFPGPLRFAFSALKQFRSFKKHQKQDFSRLTGLEEELCPDLIVSDNRYGFYSRATHSVIITHQLQVRAPFFQKQINRLIKKWLANFTEVWVPDNSEYPGLAGDLSHPDQHVHDTVRYIGPLSRLAPVPRQNQSGIYLTAVISGPSPQKEALFYLVTDFLKTMSLPGLTPIVLVSNMPALQTDGLDVRNNASQAEVESILNQSAVVICRSGYSSIMDLIHLGKKAVLIPTPGQTEQEYLANLHDNGIQFVSRPQKAPDLASAIQILMESKEVFPQESEPEKRIGPEPF